MHHQFLVLCSGLSYVGGSPRTPYLRLSATPECGPEGLATSCVFGLECRVTEWQAILSGGTSTCQYLGFCALGPVPSTVLTDALASGSSQDGAGPCLGDRLHSETACRWVDDL